MNKFLVLCALVLAVGACSSNQKKEMDQAEGKAAEMSKDAKQAADSAKDGMAKGETASKTSCTLDKDTRVIEVKKTEGGGCELFYTKFGEAKSVASSGFGTQYCEEVKDRIQTNLNKAGFSCQ